MDSIPYKMKFINGNEETRSFLSDIAMHNQTIRLKNQQILIQEKLSAENVRRLV